MWAMAEQTPVLRATRKDELVQVALEVLERDGFAHMSIGEVARRAGIKPPSLYKQFSGKDDIQQSLVSYGFELMATEFERSLADTPSDATPRERLRRIMAIYREFGHANPQLYLLMNSRPLLEAELSPDRSLPAARIFVDAVLDAAVGEDVVTSVWAWAHGILSLELVGRIKDPERSWAMLVDNVDCLRAPAG